MVSSMILAVFLPMIHPAQAARVCPNNNYKACLSVLKKTYVRSQGQEFRAVYDDICATNSKFACTKVTVMEEPEKALKEMKAERPKSEMFIVSQDDGRYIYIFDRKTGK